jgi:hypothetical protein
MSKIDESRGIVTENLSEVNEHLRSQGPPAESPACLRPLLEISLLNLVFSYGIVNNVFSLFFCDKAHTTITERA